MKVIQVLYSGLGGHGSVVTSLINADTRCEWENNLLFYGIEEILPAYKSFCNGKGVHYSFIKKQRGMPASGWLRVLTTFRKMQPDVIILHSPNLILPAWIYCMFHKKRLFVVEHTPHTSKGMYEKVCSFFSVVMARKVVCLSEAYRRQLASMFRMLPVNKKTIVIKNGIDTKQFCPSKSIQADGLHLGMIGRFSEQKNQAMLLTAIKEINLVASNGTKPIFLHFAGSGENLERVKLIANNTGIRDRFFFHGLLEEAAVIDLLNRLDIYVHASFSETMCTSVMQAMACGLPIIGSNIPGINDIVKDGENAFLFDNNDIPQLIEHILTLANDLPKRELMGRNARAYAVSNLEAQTTFLRYKEMIMSC